MNNPVNQAPDVTISPPSTVVHYGDDATFTATATDRDGDPVTISWRTSAGPCPVDVSPPSWPATEPTPGPSLTCMQVAEPLCVWAFAQDSHGARAARHMDLTPEDRAPRAALTLITPTAAVGKYPLFSTFELADASDDPDHDKLKTMWELQKKPEGSRAALVSCGTPADHQCFVATVPGTYVVKVTATEDIVGRSVPLADAAMLTLEVATDQPPCLRDYKPDLLPNNAVLLSPIDGDRKFTVRWVEDDGDPYDPSAGADPRNPGVKGQPTFRWSVWNENDGLRTIDPSPFPYYSLPSRFQAGDQVAVRLEVRDRDTARMDALFAACGEKDVCESSLDNGLSCVQRVTWHLLLQLPSNAGGP